MSFAFYRFSVLPARGLDVEALFEAVGRTEFIVVYDLSHGSTLIGFEAGTAEAKIAGLERISAGLGFEPAAFDMLDEPRQISVVSPYRRPGESSARVIGDMFNLMKEGFLAVLFIPASMRELEESKGFIEDRLSKRNVRETNSASRGIFASRASVASHRDLFTASEEAMLFGEMLESINSALLVNGLVYKTFLITQSDISDVGDFVATRFLVLDKMYRTKDLDALMADLRLRRSFPLGSSSLKYLLNPYGGARLAYALTTTSPTAETGIAIGTFMRDGVEPTGISISIEPSTLNLGFMITGLPGTGKTTEAMAIIDSLLTSAGPERLKVAIITPTDEWGPFALAHRMHLIRLYKDRVPMNFFRKPEDIDSERFYENLAMVLSSASNAGPYQNPMEKCMLKAFRKVYARESEPDPVGVYGAIEDAIIGFHAKRTNTGVKYTKHGENIRSALENLRGILSRPEFSTTKGVRMEELIANGVVFDISNASGTTRAYLYALILNQVYAATSDFDTNGDNQLRLIICLEEAQMIFGNKDSAAVQDVKQRIQDFRKQGIGLMLLTHNVGDIDSGIRRLCQSKLYLKQAPDMAALAARDLVFTYAKEEDVVLKMKLLEARVGALTHVTKNGSEKSVQDTVFIRTKDYDNAGRPIVENVVNGLLLGSKLELPKEITANVHVVLGASNGRKGDLAASVHAIRFKYLGEEFAEHLLGENLTIKQSLVEGKEYTLQILDRRNRVLKEVKVRGAPEMRIEIEKEW